MRNRIVVNVLSFIGAYLVAAPALYLAVDWMFGHSMTTGSVAKAFVMGLGLGVARIIVWGVEALWKRSFGKRRNSHA